jgi:hypothetical protein
MTLSEVSPRSGLLAGGRGALAVVSPSAFCQSNQRITVARCNCHGARKTIDCLIATVCIREQHSLIDRRLKTSQLDALTLRLSVQGGSGPPAVIREESS